jgi:hypothetical protein
MSGATLRLKDHGSVVAAFGLAILFGLHAGATGSTMELRLLLGVGLFSAIVVMTIAVPHVLVAGAIPIFALIPVIKVLALPWIGPLKDAIIIGAAVGATIVFLQRRLVGERQVVDGTLLILVGAFLGLYVVNLGGGLSASAYGSQWQQGVRLAAEPLVLLVVGLTVRGPVKVLRWSLASFLVTACGVALYGLYQQQVGQWALVGMGYKFDINIRTVGGHLRSFGTLDDPFAYAAFLLLALGILMFMRLNRWLAVPIASLLVMGLAVSYVRTAAVILVGLAGMWLAREGRLVVATLLLGAVVAASTVLILGAEARRTHTVQAAPSAFLSINGRTDVWSGVLGNKRQWPFGKGVGVVGTAADRAKFGLYRTQQSAGRDDSIAVDSGYLATVADVGLLGLAVLLGILARLGQLCLRMGRAGIAAGWIGGSILLVMMLDATTRASFIGFPSAFLGMLLVGVAINAGSASGAAGATFRR